MKVARWSAVRPPIRVHADRAAARLVCTTGLSVPPATVWRAVTDPRVISSWLESTEPVSPGEADPLGPPAGSGGRPGWRIQFVDDGEPHVKTAWLIEARTGFRYVVEWIDPGYPDSVLAVTVSEHGYGTRLTLEHRAVPVELFEGYAEGWVDYLDRLRFVLGDGRPEDVTPEPAAVAADSAGP